MNVSTIRELLGLLFDPDLDWAGHHGMYRSCFMTGLLLVRCPADFSDSKSKDNWATHEDKWPDPAELRADLVSAISSPDPQSKLKSLLVDGHLRHLVSLTIAQQRLAAALDRTINLAFSESKQFPRNNKLSPEITVFHQPPGIRLWLLAGALGDEQKNVVSRFCEAFNEFYDNESAESALGSLVQQVKTLNLSDPDSLLNFIRQESSEFPEERCLAFVDIRVNVHKHFAAGVSHSAPRPIGVEWAITANAFLGLCRLVRTLHFATGVRVNAHGQNEARTCVDNPEEKSNH